MTRQTGLVILSVGALGLLGLTAMRVGQALTRRADAAAQTEVEAAVPVQVVVAAPRDLSDEVRVAGTLRAKNEVDIVADVPGRVEALLADVGEQVKRGDTLARLEQTDLALQVEQAEAALSMAEAARDTAVRDLQGATSVAEVGGVSPAQLVAAKSRAASAEAQVKQATASLDLARSRKADATLKSPIDGVVSRRGTDMGRLITPGVPVFTVQDLSALELVVAVDERTAARVTAATSVEVSSDAADGGPWPGTVTTVAPALDANTHKAEVVIRLAPTPGLLPHGTATARLVLGSKAGVVAVPASAIVEEGSDKVVYQVVGDAGSRAVKRVVIVPGLRDGTWVEAVGLMAGASVVAAGQTFLHDGAAVTVEGEGAKP